ERRGIPGLGREDATEVRVDLADMSIGARRMDAVARGLRLPAASKVIVLVGRYDEECVLPSDARHAQLAVRIVEVREELVERLLIALQLLDVASFTGSEGEV